MSVLPVSLDGFDLRTLSDDFYADPYPVYAALRRSDPIRRMPDGSYLLSRHADVEAVYKDPTRFSSDKRVEFRPKYGDSPLYQHHTTSLVFNDAPLHTRVRRLIARWQFWSTACSTPSSARGGSTSSPISPLPFRSR